MAHLEAAKPVYVFVLKTAEAHSDSKSIEGLHELLRNKKVLKKHKTDDPTCQLDNHCSFAITGSSLPLGCWTCPKFASCISKGVYVFIKNNRIPGDTAYKWLDASGLRSKQSAGDFDHHRGHLYEPCRFVNHSLSHVREPYPGLEAAVITDTWGQYDTQISYVALDTLKPRSLKKSLSLNFPLINKADENQELEETAEPKEKINRLAELKQKFRTPWHHNHQKREEFEEIEETPMSKDDLCIPDNKESEKMEETKKKSMSLPWQKKKQPKNDTMVTSIEEDNNEAELSPESKKNTKKSHSFRLPHITLPLFNKNKSEPDNKETELDKDDSQVKDDTPDETEKETGSEKNEETVKEVDNVKDEEKDTENVEEKDTETKKEKDEEQDVKASGEDETATENVAKEKDEKVKPKKSHSFKLPQISLPHIHSPWSKKSAAKSPVEVEEKPVVTEEETKEQTADIEAVVSKEDDTVKEADETIETETPEKTVEESTENEMKPESTESSKPETDDTDIREETPKAVKSKEKKMFKMKMPHISFSGKKKSIDKEEKKPVEEDMVEETEKQGEGNVEDKNEAISELPESEKNTSKDKVDSKSGESIPEILISEATFILNDSEDELAEGNNDKSIEVTEAVAASETNQPCNNTEEEKLDSKSEEYPETLETKESSDSNSKEENLKSEEQEEPKEKKRSSFGFKFTTPHISLPGRKKKSTTEEEKAGPEEEKTGAEEANKKEDVAVEKMEQEESKNEPKENDVSKSEENPEEDTSEAIENQDESITETKNEPSEKSKKRRSFGINMKFPHIKFHGKQKKSESLEKDADESAAVPYSEEQPAEAVSLAKAENVPENEENDVAHSDEKPEAENIASGETEKQSEEMKPEKDEETNDAEATEKPQEEISEEGEKTAKEEKKSKFKINLPSFSLPYRSTKTKSGSTNDMENEQKESEAQAEVEVEEKAGNETKEESLGKAIPEDDKPNADETETEKADEKATEEEPTAEVSNDKNPTEKDESKKSAKFHFKMPHINFLSPRSKKTDSSSDEPNDTEGDNEVEAETKEEEAKESSENIEEKKESEEQEDNETEESTADKSPTEPEEIQDTSIEKPVEDEVKKEEPAKHGKFHIKLPHFSLGNLRSPKSKTSKTEEVKEEKSDVIENDKADECTDGKLVEEDTKATTSLSPSKEDTEEKTEEPTEDVTKHDKENAEEPEVVLNVEMSETKDEAVVESSPEKTEPKKTGKFHFKMPHITMPTLRSPKTKSPMTEEEKKIEGENMEPDKSEEETKEAVEHDEQAVEEEQQEKNEDDTEEVKKEEIEGEKKDESVDKDKSLEKSDGKKHKKFHFKLPHLSMPHLRSPKSKTYEINEPEEQTEEDKNDSKDENPTLESEQENKDSLFSSIKDEDEETTPAGDKSEELKDGDKSEEMKHETPSDEKEVEESVEKEKNETEQTDDTLKTVAEPESRQSKLKLSFSKPEMPKIFKKKNSSTEATSPESTPDKDHKKNKRTFPWHKKEKKPSEIEEEPKEEETRESPVEAVEETVVTTQAEENKDEPVVVVKDEDSQASSLEDFVKTTVESAFNEAFPSLEVSKDNSTQGESPKNTENNKDSAPEETKLVAVEGEISVAPCEKNDVSVAVENGIEKEKTVEGLEKEDLSEQLEETTDKKIGGDEIVSNGGETADVSSPGLNKNVPETKMKKSNSFLPWKKSNSLDSDKHKEHKHKSASLPAAFRRKKHATDNKTATLDAKVAPSTSQEDPGAESPTSEMAPEKKGKVRSSLSNFRQSVRDMFRSRH